MHNPLHIGQDWPKIEINTSMAANYAEATSYTPFSENPGRSYAYDSLRPINPIPEESDLNRLEKDVGRTSYSLSLNNNEFFKYNPRNGQAQTGLTLIQFLNQLKRFPNPVARCISHYGHQRTNQDLYASILGIVMSSPKEMTIFGQKTCSFFNFDTTKHQLTITFTAEFENINSTNSQFIEDHGSVITNFRQSAPTTAKNKSPGTFIHQLVFQIDPDNEDQLKFVSSDAYFAVNPENLSLVSFFQEHRIWDELVSSPKAKTQIAHLAPLETAKQIDTSIQKAARKSAGFLSLFTLAYAAAGAAIALGITGGWGLVPALLGAAIGFGYSLLFTPALVLAKQRDLIKHKAAKIAHYSRTETGVMPEFAKGFQQPGPGYAGTQASLPAQSQYSARRGPPVSP